MVYETLLVEESLECLTLTINRPENHNSINAVLLADINRALDAAEKRPDCRMVVIEGKDGVFCTGMDFEDIVAHSFLDKTKEMQSSNYMALLKRFTLSPKIIVCKLDGKVTAGGVGLVASSDLVVATERSQFNLTEALWGLLPCCVLPYLIRRIGFQKAYIMTLTTRTVTAREAYAFHLIDELSENLEDSIRKLKLRLNKLEEKTITNLKHYFRKMWLITEEMEQVAMDEITRLVSDPGVRENITNFVVHQKLPWENR